MKTFNTERRGYSTAEVDQYVRETESTLEQKNKQLQAYQQKEAAINQSVVEAKLLANKIIEDAQAEAENIHQNALQSMTEIKAQTKAMHEKLLAFQKDYNHILQQYLVAVRCTDMTQLFDDLDRFMDQLGMKDPEEIPVEVTDLKVEESQA